MIHRDDAIEVLALQEDGITWIWSLDVNPILSTCCHGWTDVIDFLATEGTILAVMGIQGAYCQAWRVDPGFPSRMY